MLKEKDTYLGEDTDDPIHYLKDEFETLKGWLKSLFLYGPDLEFSSYIDPNALEAVIQLFTSVNEYRIVLRHLGIEPTPVSLRLEFRTRKPRAGENWRRSETIYSCTGINRERVLRLLAVIVSFECEDPVIPAEQSISGD